MTDVELPQMAGSGDSDPGAEHRPVENSEINSNKETSGSANNVKRHKRAHSRNKSISGRQDFLEEIANSEFKQTEVDTNHGCDIKNEKEGFNIELGSLKEMEKLLPEGSDVPDHINHKNNGGGGQPPDETDALPAGLRYNTFDFFCTFLSILTYVVDLVMDCVVAYYFYHLAVDHGIYHYWYFSLTLVFIVLPSLTMTGFSFRWYLMDSDNQQLPKVGMWRWLLRLVILLLQVAPILRYVDSIRYGLKSRLAARRERLATSEEERIKQRQERRKWYTLMVYEDADATLLRLYESFMESAPQLVLQLYILLKDPHASRIYPYKPPGEGVGDHDHSEDVIEPGVNPVFKLSILVMSVASSLVSLAWSLVVYHRSLRYTYQHKKNISLAGTLFQFLWHFCSITARVLALSLFASALPTWIGPLCAAHWIIMASWIIFQRTAACNTKCEEFLFALVLGVIYIFMFFNAKEEKTRYKYLLYYTFCLIENTAIITIWFVSPSTSLTSWYVFPAMVGHYLAFFAGIMFMICYYLWFHPTGGIDIPWPMLGDKKKNINNGEDLERRNSRDNNVEMKVVMLRENRVIDSLDPHKGQDTASEAGTLDRFLKENSDKVAVRRFSSLPPGALYYTYGRGRMSDTRAARKLKYMGTKHQEPT